MSITLQKYRSGPKWKRLFVHLLYNVIFGDMLYEYPIQSRQVFLSQVINFLFFLSFKEIYVYLESIAYGQSHNARAEVVSTNHSKESSKEHNAVPNKLQPQSQPSVKGKHTFYSFHPLVGSSKAQILFGFWQGLVSKVYIQRCDAA